MATTLASQDTVSKLASILNQLKLGNKDTCIKRKVADYLEHITEEELSWVIDELVHNGLGLSSLQRFCDIHSELTASAHRVEGVELQKDHPLETFLEEHEKILDQLDLLALISEQISQADSYQEAREEMERIGEVVNHLLEIGKHFAREELILFPRFLKADLPDPSPILEFEHERARKFIERLVDLTQEAFGINFPVFSKLLLKLSDQLITLLKRHIYSENSIFYPLAAVAVPTGNWEEVKRLRGSS